MEFNTAIIYLVTALFLVFVHKSNIASYQKVLIYTIIFLESVSNYIIFQRKVSWLLSLVMILLTSYLIINERNISKEIKSQESKNSFVRFLFLNNILANYKIYVGISLALISISFERLVFDSHVGTSLIITLAMCVMWISYDYIPSKYYIERDFAFSFAHLLFLFYVAPLLLIKFYTNTQGTFTEPLFQEKFVFYLLGMPLVNLLNICGYYAWAEGISITYVNSQTNLTAKVAISSGCSGLYSILTILCAFLSYIFNLKGLNRFEVSIMIFIGIIMSYVSNIIRMFLIILSGHYYGSDALDFAHANLGWIIFTINFLFFWTIIERFLFTKSLIKEDA